MKTPLSFLLLLLATVFTAQAQRPSGKIIGSVADGNGKLPGASVKLLGVNLGRSTDLNGLFSIANIPVGDYSLAVSYIGYEHHTQQVSIAAGETVDLGTVMLNNTSGTALEEVTITGTLATSQAKAYNIQKASSAIVNVIASDVIGKLPDRNAAEAVQRIQGVAIERDHGEGRYVTVRGTPLQWNSTLINGDRMPTSEGTSDNSQGTRTSPLDIFPSEMIEYVQLAKAITPDMEGDAIGGSVNFITRTAPAQRILKVTGAGGYNNQAEKGIYSGSLLYGDHFFDRKLGLMVSGSYWQRNWGTDNFEMVYDQQDQAVNELQLRDYIGQRRTYGINTGLEYKVNADHKLFLRGIYTDFQDDETAYEHLFNFPESQFDLRRRRGIIGINLSGGELGGNHHSTGGRLQVDWKVSTYTTDMETRKPKGSEAASGVYQMAYFSAPVSFGNLTVDGKKYLDIDAPDGYQGDHYTRVLPHLSSPVPAEQMYLSQLLALETASFERDRSAQLDLTLHPSSSLQLKVGGKYKKKYLERGSPMDIYVHLGAAMGNPSYTSNYQTESFPSHGGFLSELDRPYDGVLVDAITLDQLDKLFAPDALADPLYYHLTMDEKNPDTAPSYYSGNENVAAAYIMGDYKLTDQLALIGGVRYEYTKLKYDGNEVVRGGTAADPTTEINPVSNESDFSAFLPMLHLKYSPLANLNLRAAYTRTFARANFADLNPTESVNLIFSPPMISRGNISLKPTFANNFDLMGEYFFHDIGVVSVGAFYKQLENVIYSAQTFQTIDGVLYRVTQPENSESGWLAGFETGISKRLSFLPGFWGGFGVEANYTYTTSEMNVPRFAEDGNGEIVQTIATEVLPNQSKHIFNAALFYERDALMIRLAGNYKGEALALVQGNPENYRWYDRNFTVDVSASYRFNRKLTLFLEVNNLTNEQLRYYQGNRNRPEQLEFYSVRGLVGLNYQLF
ncbi:TonB-dependent receptor [Parapedobacter tibetensis]|uniref:TonB-dependent receptor n=1 Tax=Parapedobacter tibetensis TaxID=2972951 RepID=UPI00214D42CD|nr:TonB-dependent receptor [Parapedobacter tibetensis]